MLDFIIDKNRAKEIAIEFLQQYHSVVRIEEPIMVDGAWLVDVFVSSLYGKKFKLKINPTTGHVLDWQKI